MERRVILCAGHGGGDSGAIGQGTTEANEAIDITNRTADILRKDGKLIVIQVPNELGFEDSMAWVNARFPNIDNGLSVEIHKNSAGSPAHGAEVWYYGGDNDSAAMAQRLQNSLATVLPDRGIKPDTSNRFGQLGWMRNVTTWSLLAEVGFISDGGDPIGAEANQRYATALAQGILNVWGLTLKEGADMIPAETVDRAIFDRTGQHATPAQMAFYGSRDWGTLNGDLLEYKSNEVKQLKSIVDTTKSQLSSLQQQLTTLISENERLKTTPTAAVIARLEQQVTNANKEMDDAKVELDKTKFEFNKALDN